MEFLSNLATAFIGLFQIGGEQFVGYITGIIPTLVCLITAVNALIAIIGQDKVDKLGIICSKNFLLRYTLLPILSMFSCATQWPTQWDVFWMKNTNPHFMMRQCLSVIQSQVCFRMLMLVNTLFTAGLRQGSQP